MSKLNNEFDSLGKQVNSVYGWKSVDGKVVPPQFKLPAAVIERVNFFGEQMEDGLTLLGALNLIFAYDEERSKADCELGGEWLQVSDEFKKWRGNHFNEFKEHQVALALIFGIGLGADK